MSKLSELLDNVGWSPKDPRGEYDANVFKWMQEATNRIQELQYKVSRLEETVHVLELKAE